MRRKKKMEEFTQRWNSFVRDFEAGEFKILDAKWLIDNMPEHQPDDCYQLDGHSIKKLLQHLIAYYVLLPFDSRPVY